MKITWKDLRKKLEFHEKSVKKTRILLKKLMKKTQILTEDRRENGHFVNKSRENMHFDKGLQRKRWFSQRATVTVNSEVQQKNREFHQSIEEKLEISPTTAEKTLIS